MMGAGKSSRGYKQQPMSGPRDRKTSHGPHYQQRTVNEPPPLMSHNNYYTSQSTPFGPHCSTRAGNEECSEMQRSPYGQARDGYQSNYRGDNRCNSNLYVNYNEPRRTSPSTEYIVAVRNNNANVILNLQSESYEWQDDPYNYPRYGPNDCGPESHAYANHFHQNLNNARPSSSASMHEYQYRRNHQNYRRGRTFERQSARTRSSGPPQAYRERSASRSRYNTNGDKFICPTCGKILGIKIYQCRHGHESCKNCKKHCYPCGVCGDDITFKRNIELERYLTERKLPCLHSTEGCMLVMKMTEMESHVMECPFQELQCPVGCYWRGQLKELCTHFDSCHLEKRSVDVASEVKLRDLSENSQNVYLIIVGKFHFLYHVKSSAEDRKIYMTFQLIGTKISASKWTYEVHVYNKNESRRKYVITDVCNSFVEPVDVLYKNGKCSVLHHTHASTFINHGFLTYKIFLKKNVENNPTTNFGKKKKT